MEKLKFMRGTTENFVQIQRHLFKLGYEWCYSGRMIHEDDFYDYLTTDESGYIYYNDIMTEEEYNNLPYTEISVGLVFSPFLVSILGKNYKYEDVMGFINSTKPVK